MLSSCEHCIHAKVMRKFGIQCCQRNNHLFNATQRDALSTAISYNSGVVDKAAIEKLRDSIQKRINETSSKLSGEPKASAHVAFWCDWAILNLLEPDDEYDEKMQQTPSVDGSLARVWSSVASAVGYHHGGVGGPPPDELLLEHEALADLQRKHVPSPTDYPKKNKQQSR